MAWPNKIIPKKVWTNDKVRIVGGQFDGEEGVVTKTRPLNTNAKYVWVRCACHRPSSIGHKVSVKYIIITEKYRDHNNYT